MLRDTHSLHNVELLAHDGVLGKIKDFYFDDTRWAIRYLVVETGTWLSSRRVLLASSALSTPDWSHLLLPVSLTQDQVRNSPSIDTEKPVSRVQEIGLHEYYGWPAYWLAAGASTGSMAIPLAETDAIALTGRLAPNGDPSLRRGLTVQGYQVQALDGALGHVDSFIFDDATWTLKYIVIDTRNWLPGRKVVIAPERIDRVSWSHAEVYVRLTREQIKDSPEYHMERLADEQYSDVLHATEARSAFEP